MPSEFVPDNEAKAKKIAQTKAHVLRMKIEQYYNNMVQEATERIKRQHNLEDQLESLAIDDKDRIIQKYKSKELEFLRSKRVRLTPDDFKPRRVIGRGAFGIVKVVEKVDNGRIYALKTMRKSEMIKANQLAHIKAERDFLTTTSSPWVVELFYSFHDHNYLNLVMEYLPGGDMMSLLIKKDIFSEEMTRFYMAEMVLAIESVHALGFVHRDIKPDNILIGADGHLKLSDFGLSTGFHETHDTEYYEKLLGTGNALKKSRSGDRMNAGLPSSQNSSKIDLSIKSKDNVIDNWKKNRRSLAYSTVGTTDYVAPEVFTRGGYGKECDWWSLGAIMYEMLVGCPPFISGTQIECCRKIMNWKDTLRIPQEAKMSEAARNLIRRLLTDADQRLGLFGANEIKSHPFFTGIDWDHIREQTAPFIPELSGPADTSYFPVSDELDQACLEKFTAGGASESNTMKQQKDLAFVGYTFRRFESLRSRTKSRIFE